MFSHVMIGSNDIARSKAFYDPLLAAIGCPEGRIDGKGRLVYFHDGALFMITKPINGAPASCANGGTIGFKMESPEQAEAWHKAGMEAGGEAIEDPPGVRETPVGPLFLAYMRDPDGNKLCAVYRV